MFLKDFVFVASAKFSLVPLEQVPGSHNWESFHGEMTYINIVVVDMSDSDEPEVYFIPFIYTLLRPVGVV